MPNKGNLIELYFRMCCHRCKSNAFEVALNSRDACDIKGFLCLECGNYFDLKDARIMKENEKEGQNEI